VIEYFGLARGGVGNERLVKNVENILTDLLELGFNFGAILADGVDVLVGALGLLLLLDRRDDTPRGTAGADNVLVGDRKKVALINAEFAAEFGDLLHVGNHLIVAFGLLAEAGEESLAFTFGRHGGWWLRDGYLRNWTRRCKIGEKCVLQRGW